MRSAKYGRMQHGRCIRKTFDERGNLDPIGCHENIIRYTFSANSGFKRELCNWETFSAVCTDGEVIMMTSALYGRMNHGRCIRKGFDEHGNPDPIGCSEDILRYFAAT